MIVDPVTLAADVIRKATLAISDAVFSSSLEKISSSRRQKFLLREYLKDISTRAGTMTIQRLSLQHIEACYVQPRLLDEAISILNLEPSQVEILQKWIDGILNGSIPVDPKYLHASLGSQTVIDGIVRRLKIHSASDLLQNRSSKVILGEAGSGKSSLLQYLCSAHLKNKPKNIPVFLTSKELTDSSISEFIQALMSKLEISEQQKVDLSNFDIYIDGVDELGLKKQRDIYTEIRRMQESCAALSVTVATRSSSYNGELSFFKELTILPFGREQIFEFTNKWFSGGSDPARAEPLIAQLQKQDRVQQIASQPILLALMCNAARRYSDLSRRTSTLYGQCIDTLLWEWDASRNVRRWKELDALDVEKIFWLHARIAFFFHSQRIRFFRFQEIASLLAEILPDYAVDQLDSKRVLKQITSNHGIITKFSEDTYGFLHLTIQEYLSARWLAAENRWLSHITVTTVSDGWWSHTYTLVAGSLSNASGYIQHLLDLEPVDLITRLTIVAGCLKNDPIMDTGMRKTILRTILNIYHNYPASARNKAVDMLVGLDDLWSDQMIRESLQSRLPDVLLARLLKDR